MKQNQRPQPPQQLPINYSTTALDSFPCAKRPCEGLAAFSLRKLKVILFSFICILHFREQTGDWLTQKRNVERINPVVPTKKTPKCINVSVSLWVSMVPTEHKQGNTDRQSHAFGTSNVKKLCVNFFYKWQLAAGEEHHLRLPSTTNVIIPPHPEPFSKQSFVHRRTASSFAISSKRHYHPHPPPQNFLKTKYISSTEEHHLRLPSTTNVMNPPPRTFRKTKCIIHRRTSSSFAINNERHFPPPSRPPTPKNIIMVYAQKCNTSTSLRVRVTINNYERGSIWLLRDHESHDQITSTTPALAVLIYDRDQSLKADAAVGFVRE